MTAPFVSQLLEQAEAKQHRIASSATLLDAARAMAHRNQKVLAVLRDGELEGVVTRRRLLNCLSRLGDRTTGHGSVKEAMTAPRSIVGPETPLDRAMATMDRDSITWLPVMEHGRLLGIVNERELLRGVIRALLNACSRLQEYIDLLHQAGQD